MDVTICRSPEALSSDAFRVFNGELPLTRFSGPIPRSEEHTSELQSLRHLVCRLLLEKNASAGHPELVSRFASLWTPSTVCGSAERVGRTQPQPNEVQNTSRSLCQPSLLFFY